MSANGKQVVRKGVRRGNIHTRMEEARKKRAEVLASPKSARQETVAPLLEPTLPEPEPEPELEPEVEEAKPRRAGISTLPPIIPPAEQTEASPETATPRPTWRLAMFVVIVGLVVLAYLMRPSAPDAHVVKVSLPPEPIPDLSVPYIASLDAAPEPLRTVIALRADPPSVDLPVADTTAPLPAPAPVQTVVFPEPVIPSLPKAASRPPKPRPDTEPVTRLTNDDLDFAGPSEEDTSDAVSEVVQGDVKVALNVPSSIRPASLSELRESAGSLGVEVSEPRFFDFAVSSTHVRFFHDSDREAAQTLAETLGANLRDFTSYDPLPPEGFVELWVAGRGRSAPEEPSQGGGLRQELRKLQSELQNALRGARR